MYNINMTKQEKEVNKILKKAERVKLKAEKIKNKEFGTYVIKTINEKGENGYYVGSSVDIQQRLKEHKRTFKIKYPNEKIIDCGTSYAIPYEIRTKYPDFNRRGYLIVLESQT
jgi:glucosamine 6-phosphate synthetase-like amidotransferase/phosphosugar isomerase protein